MGSLEEISELIGRYCAEGRCDTDIPRLALVQSSIRTSPVSSVYHPLVCVVAQGAKRVVVGDRIVEYRAGDYVVVSVDLPVSGEICEASADKPYRALVLRLEPAMLAELLIGLGDEGGASEALALGTSRLTDEIAEPVARLLRLLDRPADIPVLAPLLERELIYRLLQGEQGHALRQIALAESRASQIARVIEHIKRTYDQSLSIPRLAEIAGMSGSSFHRHFKAITAMTPLQYQKRIRLHEARRLLLGGQVEAARAGFAVGYESPSQFSREYARMFGAPPGRDASRLRTLALSDPRRAGEVLEA
ncbi:AraC family transcriptional regulator [Amorphus orientalis]|uniref:AraC-like DNA-binding protein n=1 Tax=Amorphus orientalis TaxID=649198 RepID=A0AAE3VSN7_9HYPH|nr:AraC family transcriptional regulator [Amorphus orientalis]MDQ0317465.1 AraC-like DNA-binding protein [Amorphus orientalis]